MTQPIDIRLPFNKNHFVPRPDKLKEVTDWLTTNRSRVLLVTSPPATGKTWFMQNAKQSFDERSDVLTFWIDVKELLPHPIVDQKLGIDLYKLNLWAQNLAQALKSHCPTIPDFQPEMDEGEYIEIAIRQLCRQCCPDRQVVIFVDQGDELLTESWQLFEKRILDRFFSEQSVRFIIAFRQDQSLKSTRIKIAKDEKDVALGTFPSDNAAASSGEEQIEKLSQGSPETKARVQQLFNSIPNYRQNHSGLNTFLYQYARQNRPIPLTSEVVKEALIAINSLVTAEIDELMDLLVGIASFPDEWTVEKWCARQNLSKTKVEDQLHKLIVEYELLVNVSTSRYIVLDGLREFIWAVLQTTSTISIETKADDPTQVVRSVEQITGVTVEMLQIIREGERVTILMTLPVEKAYLLWELFQEAGYWMQRNRITNYEYSDLTLLLDKIANHFNDENELWELCLCAGVPYSDLGNYNKRRKILELIDYCKRRGLWEMLLDCLHKARPFVPEFKFS